MKKITVIATKTLICDEGVECFTKGNEYESANDTYDFKAGTMLINNQGVQHSPGIWFNHFKLKK